MLNFVLQPFVIEYEGELGEWDKLGATHRIHHEDLKCEITQLILPQVLWSEEDAEPLKRAQSQRGRRLPCPRFGPLS